MTVRQPSSRDWLGAIRRLQAQIDGLTGGAVSSVFGRTGAVVAVLGDYAASLVTNDSSVSGATVKDALNALLADLVASAISNDSSVTGSTVKDALNTLLSTMASLSSAFPTFINGARAAGTATTAARADHQHGNTTGTLDVIPDNFGSVGIYVIGNVSQSGDLLQLTDSGVNPLFSVGATGIPKWDKASNKQTTVGSAGAAAAPPASPSVYLKVVDSAGNLYVIPAYNPI